MKSNIPTIFFAASSIINTRTFLSTYWLTSTWRILFARLIFPISNSFPYWWVTSRLPRIFKLPCSAPFPQHAWPRWHVLVLAWSLTFKRTFVAINSRLLVKVAISWQEKMQDKSSVTGWRAHCTKQEDRESFQGYKETTEVTKKKMKYIAQKHNSIATHVNHWQTLLIRLLSAKMFDNMQYTNKDNMTGLGTQKPLH